MQDDDRLTPMENELAAALAAMKPSPAATSRDHIMFTAGQATARRRSRLWQGASVLLTVALLASLVTRPKPDDTQTHSSLIVAVNDRVLPEPVASSPAGAIDPARVEAFRDHMRLRRAVLEHGIDALPAPPVSPTAGTDRGTAYEQLKEFLSAP